MRGNRKLQSTFLDEIDDPHGDYVRAGAAGHERGPQYPYTMEDVRRHDAEVKGKAEGNTLIGVAEYSTLTEGKLTNKGKAEDHR